MIQNVMINGEPGSGKTMSTVQSAGAFPGAAVILDPQQRSFASLGLTHFTGELLFDRLSDLRNPLGLDLLRPSLLQDPLLRKQENLRRALFFAEVLMRRRGGDLASSPLMEEYILDSLQLFLNQSPTKDPSILPFVFQPGSPEFKALIRDCIDERLREKFRTLSKLTPRGLRSEVGSASRLLDSVGRSPSLLLRCRRSCNIGEFLQRGGKLLIERGDENEDVSRLIMGAIILLVTEHCETRPVPWPWVMLYLDECTNHRTAGAFEERKAGETRKFGQGWTFISQHPNYPGGGQGFFANCQRKEIFRSTYEVARRFAPMIVAALPASDESRASRIDAITTDIVNLRPGWRWVIDHHGARKEYVPMLEEPWPDWPGLREGKLEEKLCEIYTRPEYRRIDSTSSSSISAPATPPRDNSADDSSPVRRLKRRGKKPTDGSPSNGDETASD